MREGLTALGVTDIFDVYAADFSAVTAAAYTVAELYGAGRIPNDEIDFVLDRPFLFVLNSASGLPMFVGIVNQPG